MARRGELLCKPRKKGRGRNFPYMGTQGSDTEADGGRLVDQSKGIGPGPRAIVRPGVASRCDAVGRVTAWSRKNTETHERDQVTR